jgi:hypothetical protein
MRLDFPWNSLESKIIFLGFCWLSAVNSCIFARVRAFARFGFSRLSHATPSIHPPFCQLLSNRRDSVFIQINN